MPTSSRGVAGRGPGALPPAVEARWTAAWGEEAVDAARRAIVRRPPLDLSFAGDGDAQAFASDHGGLSLAPHHVRLTGGAAVQDLPGWLQVVLIWLTGVVGWLLLRQAEVALQAERLVVACTPSPPLAGRRVKSLSLETITNPSRCPA